jgi:glycosyltransferase involved in cell wall biosynthesis
MRRRLALVVQRYGSRVVGGSETLAREYARRLTATADVTVFTTTARDYVTWAPEEPEGSTVEDGVAVRRFSVESPRDLAAFNAFAEPLYARATSPEEEREFLRRQGPHAPQLAEALRAEHGTRPFDAIHCFTYLYSPTVECARIAPARTILTPTAHDEPPLRFGVFRELFESVRAYAFCSEPEAALVASRFDVARVAGDVVGIGVDLPAAPPDYDEFRITRSIERPYLLYAGRIDAGKGCDVMIRHYLAAQANVSGCPDLLLIGHLAMELPKTPRIRHLGFVPEAEKLAAMAGARALICPSRYESLSITLLEAFSLGTPALVSGHSPVLRDHCERSNGGLWYENEQDFEESVRLLTLDEPLRRALGARGRDYVRAEFAWPAVMARLEAVISAVAGPRNR